MIDVCWGKFTDTMILVKDDDEPDETRVCTRPPCSSIGYFHDRLRKCIRLHQVLAMHFLKLLWIIWLLVNILVNNVKVR